MEFKDLQRVNDAMPRIPLEGRNGKNKDYAEVPARVQAFRELFPNGSIQTELVQEMNGVVVMKATVLDEEGKVLATGHAFEERISTQINQTSYIENCETSAVGRALGFLGIGSETSIASKEEVENAILQQGNKSAATQTSQPAQTAQKPTQTAIANNGEVEKLEQLLDKAGVSRKKVAAQNSVADLKDLPPEKVKELIVKYGGAA